MKRVFNRSAAQGDILVIKLDDAPDLSNCVKVSPEGENLIVTHSETGHHHVMDRKKVDMFDNKDNALESFLVVHRAAELTHLRHHDTHDPIVVQPGNYKIIRQREHTPEGFRRVAD